MQKQVKSERKLKIDRYDPQAIESKWRKVWKENNLYKFDKDKVENEIESKKKEKFYTLVELPYPSGDLHIGHWFSFVAPDILSRFKKMNGFDVFFPMGFDAFGLPAENAAIKRGIHPQDWTIKNIETMTNQFQTMGTMIDWSRVTITCLPEYYKWNQWIFLKMYEKGLAFRSKMLSNWCPVDQTVLANEHVENGRCWRCGSEVVQKEVEQWFLKITDYAEKLLWKDDNKLDWPNSVKTAQNEWIGKKEGVKIKHKVVDMDLEFESFSAYPSWSWADSYIVIAPEHPIVEKLVKGTSEEKEVMAFVKEMSEQTELERKETTEKRGVFTGRFAKDPFGRPDMPIWLANFALINFGTGIIRCSGHDERDIEFANKYHIPTREVVEKRKSGTPATPHDGKGGILHDSGPFTGREVNEVREEVIDWIEKKGIGKRFINYHLHDWSISRQRYWGTPVPMIHCKKCGIVPVPEDQLPVTLPYEVDFTPKGKAPLASNEEWLSVTCPKCHGKATRDPETLDTFFDSSWYYYRYLDPKNEKEAFSKKDVDDLMPVNIYFGGGEHTVGHTLYARFFTKFFHDLGLVPFHEFAIKRIQHGVVLGPDGNRMSKSKGNVINPDDVVKEFGTDATRLYLSFMMPYNSTGPWDTSAMYGVYRFLKRVWELQERVKGEGFSPKNREEKDAKELYPFSLTLNPNDLYEMHSTIKKVTEDIEKISNNTAVAALMKWLNYLEAKEIVSIEEYKNLILLLAPFAPYMTEELCQSVILNRLGSSSLSDLGIEDLRAHSLEGLFQDLNRIPDQVGNDNFISIHQQLWPEFDTKYLVKDEVEIVVQVNGKLRGNITVKSEQLKVNSKVEEIAKKDEKVSKWLEGKEIKKVIYVPGKILNFVV